MPSEDLIRGMKSSGPTRQTSDSQADNPPPESDWSALMASGQDGDQAAYRLLLESITPYLRALARRGGIAANDIEDLVQDILLTVHALRHVYDPKRPFGPWLVAIARRRLVDGLRRRGRISARETELAEAHVTFVTDKANLPERADDARRLRGAISSLPRGQRQAVELLKLKELSLKEAAAQSGQSETALKVAMHRAIRRLRRILGEE
jgi:RNA polymerase sigma factor (sigma-70 family)